MRLHRLKLDSQMRSLGDTYARKEFRLHAKPQATQWTGVTRFHVDLR